jgi:hypothetical protein
MERSCILAHRGLHARDDEKNSPVSLRRAIDEGFGIETDLRDLDSRLVISHDLPSEKHFPLSFEWLLDQISSTALGGRIALNIKADGLSELIYSTIVSKGIDINKFFAFDMSVPDAIAYLKTPIHTYTRLSNYECEPAFLEKAHGVWIDDFDGSCPQIEYAKGLIDKGFRVSIVSPELHRRSKTELWNKIEESGVFLSPLFELCTDFPVDAACRFCNS